MAVRAAGVVDEDVDAAEFRRDLVDQGAGFFGLGHIGGEGEAAASHLLDFVASFFQRGGAATGDRDVCATFGEQQGGGLADAGATTGDDGDTAGEIEFG
jgi:hypothetical protein